MQLVNVGMYQETDCPNKDLMPFKCVRYSVVCLKQSPIPNSRNCYGGGCYTDGASKHKLGDHPETHHSG